MSSKSKDEGVYHRNCTGTRHYAISMVGPVLRFVPKQQAIDAYAIALLMQGNNAGKPQDLTPFGLRSTLQRWMRSHSSLICGERMYHSCLQFLLQLVQVTKVSTTIDDLLWR